MASHPQGLWGTPAFRTMTLGGKGLRWAGNVCVGGAVTGIPEQHKGSDVRTRVKQAWSTWPMCVMIDVRHQRRPRTTTTTIKQQLLGPASRGKNHHQREATWMCGRVCTSASEDAPLVFVCLFDCLSPAWNLQLKVEIKNIIKSVHFSLKILAILVSVATLGDLATVNICSRWQVLSTPLTYDGHLRPSLSPPCLAPADTWLCWLLTEWLKLSSRLLTWIQLLRTL